MVKIASLFSGIGGFEKGFLQADPNTEIVFASEINKYARQIYTKNYGGKYLHGDIKEINAADVPDHDILCGGFPCQDVSIAGKREGLCGARSGLFFEIVRILREKQPKLVLLENVEGILSSNRGWDFAKVLLELEGVGYTCEWQVLNTKAFLPQNRKRVFVVGHFRGSGTRPIFPITTNDRSIDDIQEPATNCLTTRYEKAQSTGSYVVENKFDAQGIPKIAKCLTGGGHSGGLHSDMTCIPCHSTMPRSSKSGKGGTGHLQRNDDITYCLDAANNVAIDTRPQGNPRFTEICPTLQSTGYKEQIKVSDHSTIRRLVPTEVERLQGFPDFWTAEGIDSNGNIVEISDTQRYKCLGNAVTVPVIEFLAHRIFKMFDEMS